MPFYTNALIDTIALLMVIIVIVADRFMTLPAPSSRRIFHILLWLVAGVLLFDIPAWLLDGAVFPGARAICLTLDTAYYALQIIYCYFWLLFAYYWNLRTNKIPPAHRLICAAPMIIELAAILINPFTGWIFYISEENVYARGVYYAVNLVPYYLYIACSIALAVKGFISSKEPEGRRMSVSLIVFMLLPVCGAVLETLRYGISWIWPFSALSLLMVYLSVQQQQLAQERLEALRGAEEAARLKNELTNNRIAIMLSQMQPHFLYNALSSIKALCVSDPLMAARAAGDFSDFLRGNIDSIQDGRPVPFPRELEHTKHYLAIELIRFSGRLHVVYDVKTEAFSLPTLTLQPIVENAVRYGVAQRVEGGTVTISTEETPEAYTVTVSDDGVGFDPSMKKNDGRSHIGIQNVTDRLKAMCGGALSIDSALGSGTKAVITIPKNVNAGAR